MRKYGILIATTIVLFKRRTCTYIVCTQESHPKRYPKLIVRSLFSNCQTRESNTKNVNQSKNYQQGKYIFSLSFVYKSYIIISTGEESTMNCTQMISKLIPEMSKRNKYPFSPCIYRNLVIIGRIHTGKSTICNMLQNPFHISQLACLFTGTRNITFNRIITTHRDNAYVFNIIDSPGLYDCMRNEGEHLTNETLKNYLDQCNCGLSWECIQPSVVVWLPIVICSSIMFFSTVSQPILVDLTINILPNGIYVVILLNPFISLISLPELWPRFTPRISPLKMTNNSLRAAQELPMVHTNVIARATVA